MRSIGLILGIILFMDTSRAHSSDSLTVQLPAPQTTGAISLEQTLKERRSIREYAEASLTLAEISQLLWAAQGITDPEGLRSAPSAGALYPLEVYLAAANVDGLEAGIYRYLPQEHKLISLCAGDARKALSQAARDQECVRDAAAIIILPAVYQRTIKAMPMWAASCRCQEARNRWLSSPLAD
jgi:nitroreductase